MGSELTDEQVRALATCTATRDYHPVLVTAADTTVDARDVRALATEVLALRERRCEWTYDEGTDSWDTACDDKHCFITDGPRENNHRFCPYCGGSLVVADWTAKEGA